MEDVWVKETAGEGHESFSHAFTVLRDVPSVTARQSSLAGKGEHSAATETREDDLKAFAVVGAYDSPDLQAKRLDAYRKVWGRLTSAIKGVVDDMNLDVFRQLASFVAASHADLVRCSAAGGQQPRSILTAMVSTGGLNSADHTGTFKDLAAYLRGEGMHVALLQPHDLTGGGVQGALHAMLRQWAAGGGLDTQADDMEALLAWHDSLAVPADVVQQQPQHPPSTGITPTKQRAVGQQSLSAAGPPCPSPATLVQGISLASPQPPKAEGGKAAGPQQKQQQQQQQQQRHNPSRRGRGTTAVGQEEEAAAAGADADAGGSSSKDDSQQQVQQQQRAPLVLLLERGEGLDPSALGDLVVLLSQALPQLPVTIAVSLATSPQALMQAVPGAAAGRLRPSPFKLGSASQMYEALAGRVLAGGSAFPGLLLGAKLMKELHHQFLYNDFSLQGIRRGLQAACMLHFQQQPLSFLAASVLPDDDNNMPGHAAGDTTTGGAAASADVDAHATPGPGTVRGNGAASVGGDADPRDALHHEVAALPKQLLGYAREHVLRKLPVESSNSAVQHALVGALCDVLERWSCWAVTLRWLAQAAAFCGLQGQRFQLRNLLVEFSSRTGSASLADEEEVAAVRGQVARLKPQQCRQLAAQLVEAAGQVWRGRQAMEPYCQQLQQMAEEPPASLVAVPHTQPPLATHHEHQGQGEQEGGAQQQRGKKGGSSGGGGQPLRKRGTSRAGQAAAADGVEDAGAAAAAGVSGDGGDGGGDSGGGGGEDVAASLKRAAAAARGKQRGAGGSRRDSLLSAMDASSAQSNRRVSSSSGVSGPAAARVGAEPRLSTLLSGLLLRAVDKFLAEPPGCMEGACVLRCKSASRVMQVLRGAPRLAVHSALASPQVYLDTAQHEEASGVTAEWEDAAIAYHIFDQDGENVNVADWFNRFCLVHGTSAARGAGGSGSNVAAGVKSAGAKRGGAKGKKVAGKRAATEGASTAAATQSRAERTERLQQLAARFSCATAELQVLGLLRPAKRRRGAYVQRLSWMPPTVATPGTVGDGGSGLDTVLE